MKRGGGKGYKQYVHYDSICFKVFIHLFTYGKKRKGIFQTVKHVIIFERVQVILPYIFLYSIKCLQSLYIT